MMCKKEKFVEFIENLIKDVEIEEDVKNYWETFKGLEEEDKPLFTDNGKLVLQYMQEVCESTPMLKAKDIGEGLFVSSRTVSGAIRKLVSDGYVDKIGNNPVIYTLTDAGKELDLSLED